MVSCHLSLPFPLFDHFNSECHPCQNKRESTSPALHFYSKPKVPLTVIWMDHFMKGLDSNEVCANPILELSKYGM